MDAFVVTETWLTSKDRDKVWMEESELNRNNYKLMAVNRTKGRGAVFGYCVLFRFRCENVQ